MFETEKPAGTVHLHFLHHRKAAAPTGSQKNRKENKRPHIAPRRRASRSSSSTTDAIRIGPDLHEAMMPATSAVIAPSAPDFLDDSE